MTNHLQYVARVQRLATQRRLGRGRTRPKELKCIRCCPRCIETAVQSARVRSVAIEGQRPDVKADLPLQTQHSPRGDEESSLWGSAEPFRHDRRGCVDELFEIVEDNDDFALSLKHPPNRSRRCL